MTTDEPNQEKNDKIIDQAMLKVRVSPPAFIKNDTLRKAKARLDEKNPSSGNVTPLKAKNNWFTPSSIAASLVIGFFMGSLQEEYSNNNNTNLPDNKLVFQGTNSGNDVANVSLDNASKDIWLRKIAESALIGDVETAEKLIQAYKAKFPKSAP
jgi:CRISPR/Cas system-associated protein endoribonuclease Cas2